MEDNLPCLISGDPCPAESERLHLDHPCVHTMSGKPHVASLLVASAGIYTGRLKHQPAPAVWDGHGDITFVKMSLAMLHLFAHR